MGNNDNKKQPSDRHRPPHIYVDKMWYFVTCRTREKIPFFDTEDKKDILLNILKEKTVHFDIRLKAWVIMKNHYHLLFRINNKETLPLFIGQINGRSSKEINSLDKVKGRSIWYNYWDRFPRNEVDFYSYFNYIHINPLKHGEVSLSDKVIKIQDEVWRLNADSTTDFHTALTQYKYSSYSFYLRKYGESGILNIWMDYPITVNIEGAE